MTSPYRNQPCAHHNRRARFSLVEPDTHYWICCDCGLRKIERRQRPHPWKAALLLWVIIFFASFGVPALLWIGGAR
jgi:hypothetical protein